MHQNAYIQKRWNKTKISDLPPSSVHLPICSILLLSVLLLYLSLSFSGIWYVTNMYYMASAFRSIYLLVFVCLSVCFIGIKNPKTRISSHLVIILCFLCLTAFYVLFSSTKGLIIVVAYIFTRMNARSRATLKH